jgi:nicotinamide-nucleotide amidase
VSPEIVTAGLLSVGTELTEGSTQDSHLRYIGSLLKRSGFTLERAFFIPDNPRLFRESLEEMRRHVDILIVTGGLGPTDDDLTRAVVAECAGVPLVFRSEVWGELRVRVPWVVNADSNRRQCSIPSGFEPIPNANGTAPGFWGTLGETMLIALPGPPAELVPMFESEVMPLLETRFRGAAPDTGELRATSFLMPEAMLQDLLTRVSGTGITWGTRIDENRIVFTLRGGTAEERELTFDRIIQETGPIQIRRGEVWAEVLAFQALRDRSLSFTTAESCTGGMIGALVTGIPGSSAVYLGGFVTYHNDTKTELLGVERTVLARHGAVSRETALAMAEGARERTGADLAVAVTGIAGPSGGSAEKPVGTVWIGIAAGVDRTYAWKYIFTGNRDRVRKKAAVTALLLTESVVLEKECLDSAFNSAYI